MLIAAVSFQPAARRRVLLVEDHEDTRAMYAEFLESTFDVDTAADAAAALRQARQARPDVIVTDQSLPGMDGFEMVAALRADPSLADIPVVCLSGFGGSAHEARARAAGCDRILQKPCMPDALAAVVLEVLDEPQSRRKDS